MLLREQTLVGLGIEQRTLQAEAENNENHSKDEQDGKKNCNEFGKASE
jgi:hypothetical protein